MRLPWYLLKENRGRDLLTVQTRKVYQYTVKCGRNLHPITKLINHNHDFNRKVYDQRWKGKLWEFQYTNLVPVLNNLQLGAVDTLFSPRNRTEE